MKKFLMSLWILIIFLSMVGVSSADNLATPDFIRLNSESNNAYIATRNESGGLSRIMVQDSALFSVSRNEMQKEPYTFSSNFTKSSSSSANSKIISMPNNFKTTSADAAIHFLTQNAAMFKISDINELKVDDVTSTDKIDHVSISHYKNGLRVLNSMISVHVNSDGKVVMVNNSYTPITGVFSDADFISTEKVIETAIKCIKCTELMGKAEIEKVISNKNGVSVGAYRVKIPSKKPLGVFICIINAGDLSIIDSYNTIFSALGSVYTGYPIDCEVTNEELLYLKEGAGRLTGDNVLNIENGSAKEIATPDESGNYIFSPENIHFGEVNVYYHINKIHDYYKNLGFNNMCTIEAIIHNLRGISGDDAYCQAVGENVNNKIKFSKMILIFGNGHKLISPASNPCYVYHEYSHGVTNYIICNEFVPESKQLDAMHEAFSDYFSCSLMNNPQFLFINKNGNSVSKEWSRYLDNKLHYPEDATGNCHNDGRIYSGALWDIRNAIGAKDADLVIHQSRYYMNGIAKPEFIDGALALAAADKEYFNGKYYEIIANIFINRGLVRKLSDDEPALAFPTKKSINRGLANEFKSEIIKDSTKVVSKSDIFNYEQVNGIEKGEFSGNQRSLMLFGNQIQGVADSISIPDTNNQNKVVASVAKPQVNFEPCTTSAEKFDKTANLYYVLINRTALKNFTDVCESSGVTPVICPPSKHIEEIGKVGVIVEPKANEMLLETIRNYNGRPLKDVVLIVSVMNLDLKSQKIVEVHDQIRGDFNKCFETLNKMIKHPFGQRASMFRNIAKTFPGMLEKLPVSEVEANGKVYKQFDSPVVNIQLAAPGMNGEGKHVVLFHDSYVYLFVKYLPKQIRK